MLHVLEVSFINFIEPVNLVLCRVGVSESNYATFFDKNFPKLMLRVGNVTCKTGTCKTGTCKTGTCKTGTCKIGGRVI